MCYIKGRALSYKTFFQWLMISLYQGAGIMIMSLVLFENEFLHIVSISFTALILNELIMVALEITTWYVLALLPECQKALCSRLSFRHLYMVVSEVVTLFLYAISIAFLPEYFGTSLLPPFLQNSFVDMCIDLSFVVTIPFAWKVAVIVAISAMPLWIIKLIRSRVNPSASSKLL